MFFSQASHTQEVTHSRCPVSLTTEDLHRRSKQSDKPPESGPCTVTLSKANAAELIVPVSEPGTAGTLVPLRRRTDSHMCSVERVAGKHLESLL